MARIYIHLGNSVHYDPSRINAPWIRLLQLFRISSQKFDNGIFGLRPQSINASKHITQMSLTSLLFSYFVRYLCATKPIEFLSFYYLCSHILFFFLYTSISKHISIAKIDYEYWTTTPKYKLIIKFVLLQEDSWTPSNQPKWIEIQIVQVTNDKWFNWITILWFSKWNFNLD